VTVAPTSLTPEAPASSRRSGVPQADPEVGLSDDTIAQVFSATVNRWGGREALVDRPSGRRWTWRELDSEVEDVARALLASGVQRGDRVALWMTVLPEWVVLQQAIARIGAVLVSLDPSYGVRELEEAVDRVGPTHLFTQPEFKRSDYPAMAADVAGRSLWLRRVVVVGGPSWDEFLAGGRTRSAGPLDPASGAGPDDPALVLFTSGTTGRAKGVVLTSRTLISGARIASSLMNCDQEDRYCVSMGFGHVFSIAQCVLPAVCRGGCMVIPAPVFDAREVLATVEAERCTALHGVPTMYLSALAVQEATPFDLSTLRVGLCGAAAVGATLMRRVTEGLHLPELIQGWGMTETGGAATATRSWMPPERRFGSAGLPFPHSEARIVDTVTGRPQDDGAEEVGELQVRGYLTMQGYWGDPQATAEAFTDDGWLRTGDLAVRTGAGDVEILGRVRDVIVRGGEKISPDRLKEFFVAMPDVRDAEVVGVPDELLGQQIVLWVVQEPGRPALDLAEVQRRCVGQIARYKVPAQVRVVEALPTNTNGKVLRAVLREWSIEPPLAQTVTPGPVA
jgi:fatty-acyl-CoA synthase